MNSISDYLPLSHLATKGAQFSVEVACWCGLKPARPDCCGCRLVSVCYVKFELVDTDTDSITNSDFQGDLGFYCDSAYDKWCLLSLP